MNFYVRLVKIKNDTVVSNETITLNFSDGTYEECRNNALEIGQHMIRSRKGQWFIRVEIDA